jgi:hypothetical protein
LDCAKVSQRASASSSAPAMGNEGSKEVRIAANPQGSENALAALKDNEALASKTKEKIEAT